MKTPTDKNHHGHRERLRQRFVMQEGNLEDFELLELLLTYAISRRDVTPFAEALLTTFGSVEDMFNASVEELRQVDGIGDNAAILIKLVQQFRIMEMKPDIDTLGSQAHQIALFDLPFGTEAGSPFVKTYANDEIANELVFIPKATQFRSVDDFKSFLVGELPYNAASTRQRRANYIIDRFYPEGEIDTALTFYSANCSSPESLKPVLFYHILKAEPLAAKAAEEFIWPALPIGYVEREALREFILRYLPDIGASSQKNSLRSIFTTYDLLGVGTVEQSTLHFRLRNGDLESFLYILATEFPRPGTYPFQQLEQGVMHRWLLWHRDWMKQQLYQLRDIGIISKVSEIDTLRQFTLDFETMTSLRMYFSRIK